MNTTPDTPLEPDSTKYFLLDVEYKAKQSVVVVADTEAEALGYAKSSVPPHVIELTVTKVEEKTAQELEELFSSMAESAQEQSQGKLN